MTGERRSGGLGGLLVRFHRRIVSSSPPEASVPPSGLNAIVDTAPTWPVSGARSGRWRSMSHSRIVPSALDDATSKP